MSRLSLIQQSEVRHPELWLAALPTIQRYRHQLNNTMSPSSVQQDQNSGRAVLPIESRSYGKSGADHNQAFLCGREPPPFGI